MNTKRAFSIPNPNREIPKQDYEPFSDNSHQEWLVRLLDQLSVRGVTAIHYECKPIWTLPARRIGDDMLLYVTRGRIIIRAEGRDSTLVRGDCAHFRRGSLHSAATDPKNPSHIISLHYNATVFDSLTLAELLDFPDVFHLRANRSIEAMLNEACREYALRPAGYNRALEALAVRLLFRIIHDHGEWLPEAPRESKLADLRRLLPALEYLRANLARSVWVSDLAKRSGLSESQFRRVFLRTMGMLPVQYLRQLRMERASQLLRQSDMTVEAVASEVGYAETAFFAHSFKKLIGLSPGRYRETHEL